LWASDLDVVDVVVSRFIKQRIRCNFTSLGLSIASGLFESFIIMTPPADMSGTVPPTETRERQFGGRIKNKKNKKLSSVTSSTFAEKCYDIKDHVYDVSARTGGFDLFVKTTREIAEHVGSTLKEASEFCTSMGPDTLAFLSIEPPNDPDINVTLMKIKK
jgi:hypothetical protein